MDSATDKKHLTQRHKDTKERAINLEGEAVLSRSKWKHSLVEGGRLLPPEEKAFLQALQIAASYGVDTLTLRQAQCFQRRLNVG